MQAIDIMTVLRAVTYFLSAIFMSRLLTVHRLKYTLLSAADTKQSKIELENTILYAGFVLMFSGLFVSVMVSLLSPPLFDLSRGVISPGAIVVFLVLIRRIPHWIRDLIQKREEDIANKEADRDYGGK